MGPPATKQHIILNVGRFFANVPTAHHKRQDAILEVFKEMVDDGLRGWELQLIGVMGKRPADLAFVEQLRHAATGYPVQVRTTVEFDELRQAYRQSPIYWHATGFGTSEDEEP